MIEIKKSEWLSQMQGVVEIKKQNGKINEIVGIPDAIEFTNKPAAIRYLNNFKEFMTDKEKKKFDLLLLS